MTALLNPQQLTAVLMCLLSPAGSAGQSGPSDRQPSSAPASQPVMSAAADAWPSFRGNDHLTGVAATRLPPQLELLWKRPLPDAVESSAAIVGGRVYVGCDDGHVYALDLRSGEPVWTYRAGDDPLRSSPTVSGGTLLTGDDGGVMHALNIADGRVRWTFKTEGSIISSATVVGERAVFGSYDGYLYCLRVSDGGLLWKYQAADRLHGTPSVVDGRALIGGCDALLHVVRMADGQAERTIELGGVCGTSAAGDGARVYLGTHGNEVLALDWRAGAVAWRFCDATREFPYMASAAVGAQVVVVGGRDKRVRALDRQSGAQVWEFVTRGRVESSPVICGERVYVGSADGNLYVRGLADGRELQTEPLGTSILASPAVAAGRLVIGADDGMLYCFGEK